MTQITNELMFEVLKDVQARGGKIEELLKDHSEQFLAVRNDINSTRDDITALRRDNVRLETLIVRLDTRLERLERRLNLVDA